MHDSRLRIVDTVNGLSRAVQANASGDKWGLVDGKGQLLLPAIYDYIGKPLHGKLVRVFKGDFTWDEDDVAGEELFYDCIDNPRSWNGDRYKATLGKGCWGLVGLDGDEVLPIVYNAIYFHSDSVIIVNEGGSRIIRWYDGDDKKSKWSVVGGHWKALTTEGKLLATLESDEGQFDFSTRIQAYEPWDPRYADEVVGAYFK
ncbi:MAG: WG repeat-containing protein [Chitinophagaceae bacterium]|nr:MAG: WG repeat-containing protein [Chitinophagaceae bacterium]